GDGLSQDRRRENRGAARTGGLELAHRADRGVPRRQQGTLGMTGMLASVRTLDEALFALEARADFIDLKEPSQGALGALDHAAVRVCVQAIGGRRPVSATIGDIVSMDPREMTAAAERMAATGVDYIKIGFFAHPRAFDCARA